MPDTRVYRKKQSRGYSRRKVETRDLRQRFLIVCEGKRTEPDYFRCFRVPKNVVALDIQGLGFNTIRLVEEAIRIKADEEYDQIWCVFDRNSHPVEHFNSALRLAEKEGIQVAYSNPLKPERDNPSTTVHLLVLELNRFIP